MGSMRKLHCQSQIKGKYICPDEAGLLERIWPKATQEQEQGNMEADREGQNKKGKRDFSVVIEKFHGTVGLYVLHAQEN